MQAEQGFMGNWTIYSELNLGQLRNSKFYQCIEMHLYMNYGGTGPVYGDVSVIGMIVCFTFDPYTEAVTSPLP